MIAKRCLDRNIIFLRNSKENVVEGEIETKEKMRRNAKALNLQSSKVFMKNVEYERKVRCW